MLVPLYQWFQNEKRPLPWRENPTPYAVWVSEVMLQQTQVAVVIPYFLKWMERFPTIEVLAKAPLDEVIKVWEGLGYYSRARNLHLGAKQVLETFNGELPNTEKELATIKGLGPYTIGAILSFAFHQKAAAVDGNVIRVLSRLLKIEEDISKPKTLNSLREKALEILPDHEPWIINEALIELGATICKKSPDCPNCPLKKSCQAHLHGVADKLPFKSKKIAITPLHRQVAVITSNNHFLIQKQPQGKVMSGLHEFFYFDAIDKTPFVKPIKEKLNLEVKFERPLPQVKHGFTRYRVLLTPALLTTPTKTPIDGFQWVEKEKLKDLPFSSGHRKILIQLFNTQTT